MKFRSLLTAAALAALPALVHAEPKVRTITLDECLQEAFENNLDLKIIRYSPELAELALTSSYGAYDPTYSFGYDANKANIPPQFRIDQVQAPQNTSWGQNYTMGVGGLLPTGADYRLFGGLNPQRSRFLFGDNLDYQNSVNGRSGVELTQPLLRDLWIDQVRWSISLNKKTILQQEQSVRSQLIQTATAVQSAYYRVAAARGAITVQEQAVQLAERLLSENRKRVEVGAMAPLESQQAESQLAGARANLITAQESFGLAQNTLRQLLTSDYGDLADTTLEPGDKFIPQPYPYNRPESWSRGLTMRPDIIQSQLEMEKQNVTVRFRRNQMFPQLDLVSSFSVAVNTENLSTSLNQLANTDFKAYGVGARLTFPLGNRSASSGFKSAKLQREQLILQHKLLEQFIMARIDNAILVAQSSFLRIEATKQARIYGEAALDAEQKKLENGKSTTFEVLRLQRDLTDARFTEVRSLLDYFIAMVALFEIEGSTLERLGVRVTSN